MNKINESVLICSIVKNCDKRLNLNINHAIRTGEIFKDYRIIIYENNSTDNTKEELNKFNNNSKFIIKSEDIDLKNKTNFDLWAYTKITGSDHPCRIELISNARNKVIDIINTSDFNDFSYVIWIDMDSNGWDINGIINSFLNKQAWDVVYANNPQNYYDIYALRNQQFCFGPEIIGELFWNQLPFIKINPNNNLIPVYSAFGGLGIYKKEIFKNHKFYFKVNEYVKQQYSLLLKNNTIDKKILTIIENEDTKFPGGIKDEESGIFWKANSGYDGPVVCEHVVLNFELLSQGYKLFINPKMMYQQGN
jgi:hypothetical protein